MDGLGRAPFEVVEGPAWQGIRYFSTTRHGGVSLAPYDTFNVGLHVGDDEVAVQENRARLVRAVPSQPVWVEQVHGTAVFEADNENGQRPQADALLTAQPTQVLAIMTADCLPVVLGDTLGRVVAVAHAGWRGLAAGVLEETLMRLRARLPGSQAIWRAWIGPGIGREHFEVGAAVRQAFVSEDEATASYFQPKAEADKWMADLAGLAEYRLTRMGVAQVWQSQLCTYQRADLFFSHRRQQPCGRMVTVAWRTPDPRDYPD